MRRLFEAVQEGQEVDTTTCNSLLAACARGAEESLASEILAWMRTSELDPNSGTVIALARAANGLGNIVWGLGLFSELHSEGVDVTAGVNLVVRSITTEYVSRRASTANTRRSWMSVCHFLKEHDLLPSHEVAKSLRICLARRPSPSLATDISVSATPSPLTFAPDGRWLADVSCHHFRRDLDGSRFTTVLTVE